MSSTYRDERASNAAKVQRLESENARLRAGSFTALDWIGVALSAFGVAWLGFFTLGPRASFVRMFADFGSAADLPAATRLAALPYFVPCIALVPVALLAAGIARRGSLRARRIFVVLAFLLVVAEAGFCVFAMYAPIFALAGRIK